MEEIIDGFYGEQWCESSSSTNKKPEKDQDNEKKQIQSQYLTQIAELELLVS